MRQVLMGFRGDCCTFESLVSTARDGISVLSEEAVVLLGAVYAKDDQKALVMLSLSINKTVS